jgi:hypothetical protein
VSLGFIVLIVVLVVLAVYVVRHTTLDPWVRNAILIGILAVILVLLLQVTGVMGWRVDVD